MTKNNIEVEVIVLKAVHDLIDEIVNCQIVEIRGNPERCEVYFHTAVHQKLFNILLVDFLSTPGELVKGSYETYLDAISDICKSPSFENDSIEILRKAVSDFNEWLNGNFTMRDVWLSSISVKLDITMKRIKFITICGNQSKHNFTHLDRIAKKLQKIYSESGCGVNIDDVYLSFPDFYEWFHENVLSYHASTIIEFLNNIRIGIHKYLYVEAGGKIGLLPIGGKKITIPDNINCPISQSSYYELIQSVKRGPVIGYFKVNDILKLRY